MQRRTGQDAKVARTDRNTREAGFGNMPNPAFLWFAA
jgi:hypothetical protein